MRHVKGIFVVAIAAALVGLAWEYFQFGRHLPPSAATPAERIVIEKAARRMTLMRAGAVLKRYEISLGADPIGHKRMEGDGRTP